MTILTHVRPHIDDICGLWLLAKYAPEYKGADFAYVPSSEAPAWLTAHPDAVAVGTGRGRFDEHKGDVGKCATSLVWEYVQGFVKDPVEKQAVTRMVAWVLEVDTGRLNVVEGREFMIPVILLGAYSYFGEDSDALRQFGFTMLEGLLVTQKNKVQLEHDWVERIPFTSRFGPAVAFVTSAEDPDNFAYAEGYDVVVTINRERTYFNIRARATAPVDLTSVYEELRRRDAEAEWFFHHSKHMLICGGYLAPQARLSGLKLEEFVEILK
jgi:hypothetical protein